MVSHLPSRVRGSNPQTTNSELTSPVRTLEFRPKGAAESAEPSSRLDPRGMAERFSAKARNRGKA